jgi:hypothetical protein
MLQSFSTDDNNTPIKVVLSCFGLLVELGQLTKKRIEQEKNINSHVMIKT